MKRIIALTCIVFLLNPVQAQRSARFYPEAWKEVERLDGANLPASAATQVSRILQRARQDGNLAQELKAIFRYGSYIQKNREDATLEYVDSLTTFLRNATGIRKALLHSMRASALSEYLSTQRWILYGRSETTERTKDIRTWSATDLHRQISNDHLAAIAEREQLKTISTSNLAAALIPGDLKKRRPSLYDLIMDAALDYFSRDERDIARFAGGFEINDPNCFAPAAEFIKYRFVTNDSLSLEARAISLFQEALEWHLTDRSPEALIDLDLRRLAFVHDRSVDPDRDQQYVSALKELADRYASNPASAQAYYLKASMDHRLTKDEQGTVKNDRHALQHIETECSRIIARYPGSEGALNAAILLETLRKQELNVQVELMNIPGQDFRCRVAYRNLHVIHYRIIALSDSLATVLSQLSGNDYWKRIRSLPAARTQSQILPTFDDLRTHAAEIRIGGLPSGRYLLFASPDSEFTPELKPLTAAGFHVTRIAWINRGNDYFVLDRETGAPLHDAKVRIWTSEYGYGERRTWYRLKDSARTDLNGHFLMPPPDLHAWGGQKLEVEWRGERVYPDARDNAEWPDERPWINDREEYERRYRRLFLFTDRSIYRPGQTVHFKGLLVSRDPDTRRPKILTGWERMLTLTNTNGEEIDSLVLQTGAYGSFHGSFKLPERGLTGTFRISDRELGSINVQVEEYKRPTFEVTWTSDSSAFRVYDTVSTTGIATTYSGASINGARVSYRVERVPRYPYSWLWEYYGWGTPPGRSMEITHGQATTDEYGKFDIYFAAIPDKSVDTSLLPVFDYRITADVTDLNGETRSGAQTVSVGYHSLNLEIGIDTDQDLSNARDMTIDLKAANLSGTPRPVKVSIELRPLRSPQRLIRPRFWAAPDTFLMSEVEYISHFPFDEYNREAQPASWAMGSPVYQTGDSLRDGTSRLRLPLKGIPAGWYRIILTAMDNRGMPVKTQRDIRVMDQLTGGSGPSWLSVHTSQSVAAPGDRVNLMLSTFDSGLHLIQLLDGYQGRIEDGMEERGRKTPQRMNVPEGPGGPFQFPQLGRAPSTFVIPVTDADRGGFAITHAFVRQNRMYAFESLISVPWSDKELDIQTETWRDRTQPGSAEEWTVKVRGSKGEAVAAEMLMSMYDASLDQFRGHEWRKPDLFEVWPARFDRYLKKPWSSHHFRLSDGRPLEARGKSLPSFNGKYERFIWADGLQQLQDRFMSFENKGGRVMKMQKGMAVMEAMAPPADGASLDTTMMLNETVVVGYGTAVQKGSSFPVQIRKDFRETAFFLPDLKTDSLGNIRFRFKMPEALTRWKWQMLAHTKDLSMATATRTVISQKDLMVQANTPRFLREGDLLSLPAKVTNLTDAELSGQLTLEIIDAETGTSVDGYFHNVFPVQYFTAAAKQSTAVPFTLRVPGNFSKPVTFRISARAGKHTDGEERTIPVLTDRILVTESMPLRMKGSGIKSFRFGKLADADASASLTHHRLTAEWSTNPSWYAVESLPYLTSYPYDCAEQSFNKFYANAIAHRIVSTSPAIRAWQERMATDTTGQTGKERLTPLNRNPELRDVLLEETPWVFDARQEDKQRKEIRNLFDAGRLNGDLDFSLGKVAAAQTSNGGFTWFHGGPDDRYMTQYILTGFARLKAANAIPEGYEDRVQGIITNGIGYLQKRLAEDLNELERNKSDLSGDIAGDLQVQCLYTLSGLPEIALEPSARRAYDVFRKQASKWWPRRHPQLQAMTALMLHRTGDGKTAKAILRSLKEYARLDSILGMYWAYDGFRGYWSDAPVETQAMIIQAFSEIDPNDADIDRMREWLLSQKQTNRWGSTRATAEACHALLMTGTDWLSADRKAEIQLGKSLPVIFRPSETSGVGYLKGVVDGEKIKADMGEIRVSVTGIDRKENAGTGWGAVHWQYFEHMDRIAASTGPLGLKKQFFIERKTDRGPVLEPLADEDDLKVGDKLVARMELRVDRDLEYVHLKDLRAAGTEPVNVISGYRWRGGLGYYESTKDASTNFFFHFIPKGTHVFEYPMFVSHNGKFSAGIATVECMYAPEFRAHSEGLTLRVR
jgi:hypothetical protein